MGFRAAPFVLWKNGCWLKGAGTQIVAQKCLFHQTPPPPSPPHMCSQNDQRDVGIILRHIICWGPPPPMPPQVGHPPPPETADKEEGGGLGTGPLCPPPPEAIFFSPKFGSQGETEAFRWADTDPPSEVRRAWFAHGHAHCPGTSMQRGYPGVTSRGATEQRGRGARFRPGTRPTTEPHRTPHVPMWDPASPHPPLPQPFAPGPCAPHCLSAQCPRDGTGGSPTPVATPPPPKGGGAGLTLEGAGITRGGGGYFQAGDDFVFKEGGEIPPRRSMGAFAVH